MANSERDEFGHMLRDAWLSVLLGIVIAAAIVFGIFQSSKFSYAKEVERLEIQKARAEMAVNPTLSVWTFTNQKEWYERKVLCEYREVERLVTGVEYTVGQLREYDRNHGFNRYILDTEDELLYFEPILTVYWDGYIKVETSLQNGWLKVAPMKKNIRGEYKYLPSDKLSEDHFGEGATSIVVPINGVDNIAEADGVNNLMEVQRLGDYYSYIPEELADRTREVWSYLVTVTAYHQDPRDKKSQNAKPVAKLVVKVRRYGDWDISEDEFNQCGICDIDFFAHTTVEVIHNGKYSA